MATVTAVVMLSPVSSASSRPSRWVSSFLMFSAIPGSIHLGSPEFHHGTSRQAPSGPMAAPPGGYPIPSADSEQMGRSDDHGVEQAREKSVEIVAA